VQYPSIRTALLALAGLLVAGSLAVPIRVSGQASAATQPIVTFSKDIAPILRRSCQGCHRPNSLAPMPLITYDDTRPYAASIRRRTAIRSRQGTMPPWYIEKDLGIQHYKNDISLSDDEIAKIAAWVDHGTPRGNPADMPPPLKFADGNAWTIGTPDLVVLTPPVTLKAVNPDWWGSAGFGETGLTEDRYVSAVEIREVNDTQNTPGSTTTVGGLFIFHHAIMSVEAPGASGAGAARSTRKKPRPSTLAQPSSFSTVTAARKAETPSTS